MTLRDRVITEGLATAFERYIAHTAVPWGEPPEEEWIDEVLRDEVASDPEAWMFRHPDGRRWIGMRVGTRLVDRACGATGKSSAELVFAPTDEILRLAGVPMR